MTRINTNVSSLVAQNALAQSHQQLQTALTRLSTGLQINSGADNPAGLIAAQALGSDIVAANAGISNSQVANQLIATADSALGQVSTLLNNIRGLVSDAANTGALSSSQIAADQLQVDSSLQAIDSIAQSTSFQGSRLLDGSLNFLTTSAGTADVRASGTFGATVTATASGTLAGGVADAAATGNFGAAVDTKATASVGPGAGGVATGAVVLKANQAGVQGNGYAVTFTRAASLASSSVTVDTTAKTVAVTLASGATATQAVAAITGAVGNSEFTASVHAGTALFGTSSTLTATSASGVDNNNIVLTANNVGTTYNGVNIVFANDAVTAGNETAAFTAGNDTLTIHKVAASNTNQVIAAINATGLFSASTAGAGLGTYSSGYSSVTSGGTFNNNLKFSAVNAGAAYNGLAVTFLNDVGSAGNETASYNSTTNVLTINKNAASDTAQVIAAVNATGVFAAKTNGSGLGTYGASTTSGVTTGGANGNQFTLSARTAGAAFNNVNVKIQTGAAVGAETAAYSSVTNTLTITANASSTTSDLVAAVNGATGANGAFSATAVGSGLGTYSTGTTANVTTGGGTGTAAISGLQINQANFGTATSVPVNVTIQQQATQGQLTYSGGTLASATTLQIGGDGGFQVFNFGAGATVQQIASALNSNSDATGVTAAVNGSNLVLSSQNYGSSSFVSAQALTGTFATTDATNATSTRATGTDVQARINGVDASGNGLQASIDTPSLNLQFTVNSTFQSGDSFNFSITGGGANFQLGPDVVSNEQARLGIQGVSTATLGGADGTLYQLQSGGSASLATNPELAAKIVDEVINQVTTLSGRLGAFQSTTLQTNINTLTSTVSNLTAAQSDIQDADYAAESANLTRAQILVQAGTSVLQISNQAPQQILTLLQGH